MTAKKQKQTMKQTMLERFGPPHPYTDAERVAMFEASSERQVAMFKASLKRESERPVAMFKASLKRESERLRRAWHDWQDFAASPEGVARDKLMQQLKALMTDSTIAQSDTCIELLGALRDCLDYRFMAPDSGGVITYLTPHFDKERASKAAAVKAKKCEEARIKHHIFLDQQDNDDTSILARRLCKKFPGTTTRGAEDAVRAWKKLRRAGKT